jgi:hypothetical protein
MRFSYRLVGTGWSEATLDDGDTAVTITASYLSDALGDLVTAAVLLNEGAEEVRFSWEEEPGEYRWIFERISPENVALRILWFDDQMDEQPDVAGKAVFVTTEPITALSVAVANGARALLNEIGESGYAEKWVEYPFPTTALEQLEALQSH